MKRFLLHALAIITLTFLTQVGGLVYGLVLLLRWWYPFSRTMAVVKFIVLYAVSSLWLLPGLAPHLGRVPLPIASKTLRARTPITVLLNRHYVVEPLREQVLAVSRELNREFPGTTLLYLDANFPFLVGFPLLPHRSHNDGRKLDLAFLYTQPSGELVSSSPSLTGYGVYEEPRANEPQYPQRCAQQGYFQYSMLAWLNPSWLQRPLLVDSRRTRRLVELLAQQPQTQKLFIEPHLKQRWGLWQYTNIRFQGCAAVRHDDHIHLQIN